MRRSFLLVLCSLAASGQTTLSLSEAVSQALQTHPLLAAGAERTAVSEGLRRQAGLRPNPRLILQTENLRAHGSPGFRLGQDADTFAYLSQPVETGGKRDRRVEAAAANLRQSQLARELLAREIASRVKQAYWNAAGAERLHALLLEAGRTFQRVVDYHELRVREGAMAEADLLRVKVESERLAITAGSAALEAERARIQLFREMGAAQFPAVSLSEPLDNTGAVTLVIDPSRALEDRTETKLARQAVEQARARLQVERSAARPDLDVVLGYKRTAGFNTLLGGVQVGLPLASRNQGNIAAAQAEVRVAEASLAAVEATVRAEVNAARTDCELRRKQLVESLRPLREHASESSGIAQAAYREGGSDLLRLLDSERVRLEVEVLYHRTLAEYRQSVVALETAMGVEP